MSFIMQLFGNAASMIQTDAALKRQRQDFAQSGAQALAESQQEAAAIQHRANLIQGAGIARAGASGGEDQSTLDVLVDNAQQIGLDIARAAYRGEMGWWAGQEGAKQAKFAQKVNWVTGMATSMGSLAQGLDKYGKYLSSGESKPLEGSQEMFFSNATSGEPEYNTEASVGGGGFGSTVDV